MAKTTTLAITREQALQYTAQEERQRLFQFIRKRVKNDADAEDLLQDVLLQLSNNDDLVKPIRQVSAWLFTVARNKIIDFYRKKRPVTFSQLAGAPSQADEEAPYLEEIYFDPSDDPAQQLLRQTVWDALEEALEALPPEQREVFVLHELEGKSFKAIAEMTGISVNTLLSRKRYAVMQLREQLQHVYDALLSA